LNIAEHVNTEAFYECGIWHYNTQNNKCNTAPKKSTFITGKQITYTHSVVGRISAAQKLFTKKNKNMSKQGSKHPISIQTSRFDDEFLEAINCHVGLTVITATTTFSYHHTP